MGLSSILFFLGCTVLNGNWAVQGSLPVNFFPASTRMTGPNTALFAGYLQGGETWAPEDQTAAVFRWDGKSYTQVWDGPGVVQYLDVQGDVAWLLGATRKPAGPGSDYTAARSTDGGRTWESLGPVLVDDADQVLVVSRDEAWVLGVRALGRTSDGGRTWVPITAPGERNCITERLRLDGGRVLITGDGVRATKDGGATWLENGVEGSRIEAVAGPWVLARRDGVPTLGKMEPGAVNWLAKFPKDVNPIKLLVDGSSLRFLAAPAPEKRGMLVYESDDAGTTWKAWSIRSDGRDAGIDISVHGGIALDVHRRVLAPG